MLLSKFSRSISVRVIFVLLALILELATFITLYLVVSSNTVTTFRERFNRDTSNYAVLASEPIGEVFLRYKDSGTLIVDREVSQVALTNPDVQNIAIVDVNSQQLFVLHDDRQVNVTENEVRSLDPLTRFDDASFVRTMVVPINESNGVHRYSVYYEFTNDSFERDFAAFRQQIFTIAVVIALISSVLFIVAVNVVIIRPIRRISEETQVIAGGHYSQPISEQNTQELTHLAGAVSRMAARLGKNIEELKEVDEMKSEFMSIASHYLRTPIAGIRGSIEVLDDPAHKMTEETQKHILENIEDAAERLHELTESMLMIASFEAGKEGFSVEGISLTDTVAALRDEFTPKAHDKGLQLICEMPDTHINIIGSKKYLEHAFRNILSNAIKFTKTGTVAVTLDAHEKEAILKFKDSGVGIEQTELEQLFTKFHRGNDILEFRYEGLGLGLYMVKLIIERHHGTVSIDSTKDLGTTVTVTLPL